MVRMFIRRTNTNNSATGESYFTHRLVRGERIGGKVRQITVLNLGRHFPVPKEDWALLCSRIEQLLMPQALLCLIECPPAIESLAQRYWAKLVGRAALGMDSGGVAGAADGDSSSTADGVDSAQAGAAVPATPGAPASDMQTVDIESLKLSQPRSVGVENVALHAIKKLGLIDALKELGLNTITVACILGNLVARMAAPASELATWGWLHTHSALGELLDVDFEGLSHMRLYRASDVLMKHRQRLEDHVFGAVTQLFSLQETVTLYDLTNTYFEGQAQANPKAEFGRSKEKRSDCPLLTLGLVLDGSGFVRRSKTFEGNVSEGATLQGMLASLQAPLGALVIMDAGIATQANIDWLIKQGYRYLVVRRGGVRAFDATQAVATKTMGGEVVRLQKQLSADGAELELRCHSTGREAKELAMVQRSCDAFEASLQKIVDGLAPEKLRSEKRFDKLQMRIGRLKQKSQGVSQHYTVTLTTDAQGKLVTALTWKKELVQGTMATHPGVYCLRTNILDWDEEKLWHTYSLLTDIESVFRSLKGELGLRPVFHQTEGRSDGHMFITVLAYQCVQVIRTELKQAGITQSWASLRKTLQVQQRVSVSLRRADGRVVHVRKSTQAEPQLLQIYQALGMDATAGGVKKLLA